MPKPSGSDMFPRKYRLLVHSAKQVVQVVRDGRRRVVGEADMRDVAVLSGGISIVVNREGYVEDIGPDSEIASRHGNDVFDARIDASGMCVLPGLVDAHTHPVWAGDRVHEFAMKLEGATYMEVHEAGGGIHFTVDHTRRASERDLLDSLLQRLRGMLRAGTTLAEAKSGYGLDKESEVKLLRVIETAKRNSPVELSTTFCGAHAIPRNLDAETATRLVVDEQIPEISRLMTTGELGIDSIDVFCERGVFDLQQSRKILEAGRGIGLRLNFHGDELNPMQAAEMGAELGAEAISHLEEVSDEGIEAMARSGSVAVVLPTTAYILRLKPPPVREMIARGVCVALGSDFNPNAYCLSMPLVMHLACVNLQMSMAEALVACTINGAAALGKSETHGSIEVGKVGDLVIIDAPRWEHLIYQMGEHNSSIRYVIKRGSIAYTRESRQ